MTNDLSKQIDKLVRDHIAQVHAEAAAALAQAFAASSTAPVRTKTPVPKRKMSPRRDPAMVNELAEQLHAQVMAAPGEPMVAYAKALNSSVRELHLPMTRLKRSGRLRTTGVRNDTRYYPSTAA